MAEWIESVLSGFESQLSEVRAHDLPPHLGRTEPAVILGASAIWQGGEGPGHEALLGRAAGQARGSGFERRHSTAILTFHQFQFQFNLLSTNKTICF